MFKPWSFHEWGAYQMGYDAVFSGKTLRDNPYQNKSLHQKWINGWMQGRKDDTEAKRNLSYQSYTDTETQSKQ